MVMEYLLVVHAKTKTLHYKNKKYIYIKKKKKNMEYEP